MRLDQLINYELTFATVPSVYLRLRFIRLVLPREYSPIIVQSVHVSLLQTAAYNKALIVVCEL